MRQDCCELSKKDGFSGRRHVKRDLKTCGGMLGEVSWREATW